MRVLQLIDSLEVGGAERVAVNIANALSTKIEGSYLCATRVEGLLKNSLKEKVNYLFLNKKSILDFKAIFKFNKYVRNEKIDIIHAHSSSFFLATLIRFFNKDLKIVWHDHYGNSQFLEKRKYKILNIFSKYFDHVFSVNEYLENWAKLKLKAKRVFYLPNFSVINSEIPETILHGKYGSRIICLANFRAQKDHITLLKAFKMLVEKHIDWSLHLVGKDFNNAYSKEIKTYILNEKLVDKVFIYGSKPDTFNILSQAKIGVLSSKSEGLPLALLEYGLANLPVIVTDVGECSKVMENDVNGILVPSENSISLYKALLKYIENKNLQKLYAQRFNEHIIKNYSEKSLFEVVIITYKNLSN